MELDMMAKAQFSALMSKKTTNFQFVRVWPIANSLFIWRKGICNTVIHSGMITGVCMASFHPWVIPHVCKRVLSYASQSLRSFPGNCLCCGSSLLGTKFSLKAACWEWVTASSLLMYPLAKPIWDLSGLCWGCQTQRPCKHPFQARAFLFPSAFIAVLHRTSFSSCFLLPQFQ